jgi:hypothetical protein
MPFGLMSNKQAFNTMTQANKTWLAAEQSDPFRLAIMYVIRHNIKMRMCVYIDTSLSAYTPTHTS